MAASSLAAAGPGNIRRTGRSHRGSATSGTSAVHPDWTGLGLGRVLFTACERQAKTAGQDRFECCATLNAEGFYQALGFTTLARTDTLIAGKHRFASVTMTRPI